MEWLHFYESEKDGVVSINSILSHFQDNYVSTLYAWGMRIEYGVLCMAYLVYIQVLRTSVVQNQVTVYRLIPAAGIRIDTHRPLHRPGIYQSRLY